MEVMKRNGILVPYDGSKIVLAIQKAMIDVGELNTELSDEIENSLTQEIVNSDDPWTVEEISDKAEELLMEHGLYKVAKAYILYRNERTKGRTDDWNYKLLTKEFLSKYKHKPNPMKQLGSFVYYRTYSRWLPNKQRREYWWETVARAVDYNCSLIQTTKEEAEKLYDNIFNLRQFLSGRTFWVGGTEVAKYYPMANYNCSFTVVDSFEAYKDLFYLLMVGSGVGVRVLKSDVEKIPKIRSTFELIHEDYSAYPKHARLDSTTLDFINNSTARIIIGDSKEGWVQSLDFFLKLLYSNEYRNIQTVIINYNHVRPKGEKLKTFGGTASGHHSLKNMFKKISKVIQKRGSIDNSDKIKLLPIDCLDIANIIGENVVVGGVRRTAEIGLIDANDKDIIQAKNNLYKQIDGQWIVDQDIIHRQMSNNSIYYQEKPSREQLHWQIEQMRFSGEPAWINEVAGAKRRDNMNGVNPCLTGNMKILTVDGYKTLEELNGQSVKLINNQGLISEGQVWCNGEKEIYTLNLSNVKKITCTKDHRFMLIDGSECETVNLKDKRLMPYLNNNTLYDDEFVKYGFIQGDGGLGRLKSQYHKGLEVNIGENDSEIADLFRVFVKDRTAYVNGYNEILQALGFSAESLPNRIFPTTYSQWAEYQKISFIRGCYSANGSVLSNGRITYKATCFKFIQQLKSTLSELGINSYITTNKKHKTQFLNGEYECKESYDLNIIKYEHRVMFFNMIGFVQTYKTEQLNELLIKQSPKITSVKNTGKLQKVYDFSEPINHWGVVEGFITHNCGEILLDSKGLCNLTTINVYSFVNEDGTLDLKGLLKAQRLSVRAGYRLTCVELELPKWNYVQNRDKLLGCSLTGWQDMVNAVDLSRLQQKSLLKELREIANKEAKKYANEIGENEPLLVTTVKPEGTLSQLPTVSSGVHYSHSPYYIRRVRINAEDPLVKVCEELNYPIFPEVGQELSTCSTKVIEFPVKAPLGKTKYDISAIEQLENYKLFMDHYVDHNCSITVHVREHEWDLVEKWIWENWDDVVAVSFLALDDNFYQLLPYEAITEEEYNKRVSEMKPFNSTLISKYEKDEVEFDIGNDGCTNGVCPIR